MSIFDAVASAVGEATACLAGRLVGRRFHIEPKRAQRIGEYIVIFLILGGGLLITVVYS